MADLLIRLDPRPARESFPRRLPGPRLEGDSQKGESPGTQLDVCGKEISLRGSPEHSLHEGMRQKPSLACSPGWEGPAIFSIIDCDKEYGTAPAVAKAAAR
jgi:hypothetical protein